MLRAGTLLPWTRPPFGYRLDPGRPRDAAAVRVEPGEKVGTPHGPRTCLEARIGRAGRKPLVARFGGIPLKRQKKAVLNDRQPVPATGREELIARLQKGWCELCEHRAQVEVHQVAKLADLSKPGQPQPTWANLMARMRRKTLVVCAACHHRIIHPGQPTAVSTEQSLES